jgi:hypothetical protein
MRRKNRKWVATAVVLYLLIMWSAYRWGIRQRPADGSIFDRIERDGIRRQAEERARAAKEQAPPPATGEARLNAAGPAYVGARYDATHVVFVVATDTEARFSNSPLIRSESPTRVSASAKPVAPLAGLEELWEPDSQSLHFFPKIVQTTQPGDQWSLNVSPDLTIPVSIDRVVIAPTGCSLAMGFLASVPPDQQTAFRSSPRDYFVVRRNAVDPAGQSVVATVAASAAAHIAELPISEFPISEFSDWGASTQLTKQLEQELKARMKEELAKIDARLVANAASPGATAAQVPIGDARPRLKEWLHADHALARGEGTLDYDVRSFRLTPDSLPRLFVRARWKLAGAPVFLMSAWFKTEPFKTEPLKTERFKTEESTTDSSHPGRLITLLFADSSWSFSLRNGEAPISLGDRLDFQTVLNEFDADRDGWAELLIHSYDGNPQIAQGNPAASSTIGLYLYTDQGLVTLRTPFRRDLQSPESCLNP